MLLIGIALTGMTMRYLSRVDVTNIKALASSLVAFHPYVPAAGDISI